jgi:hypothetical protein
MRKLTLAIVGLVALAVTSVAIAHGIEGAKTAKSVAGTFTAAAGAVTTRTCTTTDSKTIVITDGRYTGAATGAADLTGAITLRARSVVNTTDKVGVVDGAFRIDVANGKDTTGAFSTVYDNGTIAGLASGRAHASGARLLGNVSASFSAATGFTGGKIGGATAGGSAVEIGPGSCKPSKTAPEKSEARGTVTAISATAITVAGVTCAIPADKSADVNAKVKQGDRVEIKCSLVNGQNTLSRVEKRR